VTGFAQLLESRASFELAAHLVTWAAVVVLGLIAVSLHARLQRLERVHQERNQVTPFAHLLGRTVEEALNGFAPRPRPRLILFLSPACPACERLLAELRQPGWAAPAAVAWTGRDAGPPPELPPHAALVPDGPAVGAHLGVRLTPFALVADENGVIVKATPVNSLDPLRDAVGSGLGHSVRPPLDNPSSERSVQ
jgi:hypothetical protein